MVARGTPARRQRPLPRQHHLCERRHPMGGASHRRSRSLQSASIGAAGMSPTAVQAPGHRGRSHVGPPARERRPCAGRGRRRPSSPRARGRCAGGRPCSRCPCSRARTRRRRQSAAAIRPSRRRASSRRCPESCVADSAAAVSAGWDAWLLARSRRRPEHREPPRHHRTAAGRGPSALAPPTFRDQRRRGHPERWRRAGCRGPSATAW
mmetsp:Transcript_41815/g.129195  ORF Transcript_41815/g.129195 Transcript_41815/m.129195 type:complete len:208 (-) Transcript_41815:492-1115(-)